VWPRRTVHNTSPWGCSIDATSALDTDTVDVDVRIAVGPDEATADGDDGTAATAGALGWRAARTRTSILDAAKRLFLDRGYAGTRISNITDACGISRAGFYTYFKDKREVFNVLGETAYRDTIDLVGRWDDLPRPCTHADVDGWVRAYFRHLDQHGAFNFSAQSAPADDDVREASKRLQMRVGWLLGMSLRRRQQVPTDAPEALGLATQAMLDRSWFQCRAQGLPVDEDDMIRTVTSVITGILGLRAPADGPGRA
jgi:AcrR family transcriptional regulator